MKKPKSTQQWCSRYCLWSMDIRYFVLLLITSSKTGKWMLFLWSEHGLDPKTRQVFSQPQTQVSKSTSTLKSSFVMNLDNLILLLSGHLSFVYAKNHSRMWLIEREPHAQWLCFSIHKYSFKTILSHWSWGQNMHSIQRDQTQALMQETHQMLSSSGSGNLMEAYGILEQTWDQSPQNEVI